MNQTCHLILFLNWQMFNEVGEEGGKGEKVLQWH